ncbi:MAG TPA: hypothetical protein VF928_08405 [Usitatibacteraceae bacterium]
MIDCTHLTALSAQSILAALPDPTSCRDDNVQVRVTLPGGDIGIVEFSRLHAGGNPSRNRGWYWVPVEIPDELLQADPAAD